MQIHEITLSEAIAPLDPKKIMATARPTRFNYGTPPVAPRVGNEPPVDQAAFKAKQDELLAKQAQYQARADQGAAQSRANVAATPAPTTRTTPQTVATNPGAGAQAFGQMAQQLAPQNTGPTASSTQGTITPTSTGLVHTASDRNPNPRAEPFTPQQKWDIEYRKLQNQYPNLTPQQYQKAMIQRTGTARPGGVATQPAPVQRTAPVAQPSVATRPTPRTPRAVQPAPAPTTPSQYPPITLGTGPKAQTYVNKGSGYVDSKTNKPMPPAILKALNIQ